MMPKLPGKIPKPSQKKRRATMEIPFSGSDNSLFTPLTILMKLPGILFLLFLPFLAPRVWGQTINSDDVPGQILETKAGGPGRTAVMYADRGTSYRDEYYVLFEGASYGPYEVKPFFGFLDDGRFWYEAQLGQEEYGIVLDRQTYTVPRSSWIYRSMIQSSQYRTDYILIGELQRGEESYVMIQDKFFGPFQQVMNVWGQQNDYKIAFQGSRGFGILTEAEEIGGNWSDFNLIDWGDKDSGHSYTYTLQGESYLVMKGETFGPLEELELIYSDERIREEVSQVMENTSMGKRLFAWGEFGPAYQEITQIQGQVGEIESYVGIRDQEYTIHFQGETYGPFPPFEKYYKIGDRWYWFRETHEGWFYNQNEILQGPLYNPSRLWYVLDYPQGKYTQDGGDLLILAKSGPEEITLYFGDHNYGTYTAARTFETKVLGSDVYLYHAESWRDKRFYKNGEEMTQGLFPIKELFFWPDQLGPPNVAYQEIQDILRADSSHSIPYYVLWGDQWIGPLVLYLNDLQYTRRINTPVLSTVEGDYVPQPDGSLHGPLQGVRGGYNSNGGRLLYAYQEGRSWFIGATEKEGSREIYGPFTYVDEVCLHALDLGYVMYAEPEGYFLEYEGETLGPFADIRKMELYQDQHLRFEYGPAAEPLSFYAGVYEG
jgi:hypothetical protein